MEVGHFGLLFFSISTISSPTDTKVHVCVSVLRSPTCVEDTGGQRRRKALVQQQFAENLPGGLAREAPLQRPQPEVVEVAVESDGHHGHVARVPPVDALLLGDELVGKVTAGEQAAVQGDVGQPGEPLGGFFQHGSAHVCLARGEKPGPGGGYKVTLGGPRSTRFRGHSARGTAAG